MTAVQATGALSSSSASATTTAAAATAYIRRDGRTALELRGKEMRLSELAAFDGSSWYAQGQTAVMVSLHGPTLSRNEAYDTCQVRVQVQHAHQRTPSAGGAERAIYEEMKLELLTRTDAFELESLLESTIDAVFIRDRFPRCVLVVDVVVVQDDGSLPAVALNAVMCALLDAGLPCRTTMAAVSVAAVSHADGGASSSLSSPSSTGAVASGSNVEFLLDPTCGEETLGLGHHAAGNGASAAVAEKGDLSGSANAGAGPTALLRRDAGLALQDQYRCISTGVFVFSNPSCGGGLLAQLVRRRGGHDGAPAGAALSLEAYAQMLALAERAAAVLFEFFRQCNVAV
ncbi:putative ribosomal RNA processing protein [Leptomonas seymouri]|uniref:Putative ribosomal RNA processing protein n=1 Tax=Leptomonas seymouri TaxID=5684 RepID=A0A0N1IIN2_LEPSE|nr:putative ribosomal RNA processing protein [Leptomonas seymouri]|eukprot:KPI84271.1 putative ribosomal RNA processing protein [Leptomonas seymouri]